jgi:hypothetical protein
MRDLPAPELYLPFESGRYRLAMGLQAIAQAAIFEIDARYHEEVALKRDLLAGRRDAVFAALPVSDPVRPKLARYVTGALAAAHPSRFGFSGFRFSNHLTGVEAPLDALPDDPLAWAGLQVQEDLCVMQRITGRWCLAAASLSFPSRWRLAEKLGQPMMAIHQPVPGYAERLAGPVDQFFDHLRPGRVVCRFNWTIHDSPVLHQPEPSRSGVAIMPDALFLRVERQTLSLVPETEAILFTIKVQVTPLSDIAAARPGIGSCLAEAVRGLPPSTLAYRGMDGFRDPLLDWLERQ